ncbi:uncharacterized protein LOC127261525 [Andrographis paniculata]|uniref:uncharacterized protein LOC127261525 n=1 Tax=Andrographis paniculata TaxID=175694 RepID=UPI0021E8B69B|nr:uncharacterized protein LOC127261525 [Andrographis paniculata]
MTSPCIDACRTFSTSLFQKSPYQRHCSGNHADHRPNFSAANLTCRSYPFISCSFSGRNNPHVNSRESSIENCDATGGSGRGRAQAKGKDNVWSIDNERSKVEGKERTRTRRKRGGKRVRSANRKGERVLVSGTMLMEVETVLQTQEPVIRPAWHTFASSISGIWKGVGAVYSPVTAEMEPIEMGSANETLFDCYTLSHIQAKPSTSGIQHSEIKRKINWVTLNPYGEAKNNGIGFGNKKYGASSTAKETSDRGRQMDHSLPTIESFDFGKSDIMEEDDMGMEPGLVFFEDGSYSRGPVNIPIGEFDESKYYLSPTFKFEQCLVKGCHKRLRVVHTIEFTNGGSDIQILRVAVYEEEWVSPANIPDTSEMELDLKPFSQRKRVQPSDLSGSWKVFEVSATPIYDEGTASMEEEEVSSTPYVYLCTENLKNRSLPDNLVYFGEEEMLDMQDVTILWLPGGVTTYVDVGEDGILCIGVGWYSDEGINLVMERDYGLDGKLKEVRWKSEMKRRWTNPPPM